MAWPFKYSGNNLKGDIVNNVKVNSESSIELLNEGEIDQVGGALAPLVVYGLWMGGGVAVGFAAAAVVHYFGKGNHTHV